MLAFPARERTKATAGIAVALVRRIDEQDRLCDA
jgi:hypothetical protein